MTRLVQLVLGTIRHGGSRRPLSGSFGAAALFQACGMLIALVLARGLAPAGRGAVAAAVLWPTVLVIVGSAGIPDALTYHVARRAAPLGRIVATAAAVALVQGVALLAAGMAAVSLLSGWRGATLDAAYLCLACVPLILLSGSFANVLQGSNRFGAYQAVRIVQPAAAAAAIAALAAAGRLTVLTAVAAYAAAHVVTLVLAAAFVARACAGPLRFDGSLARSLARYGIRSHSSTLASMLNERLDQLLISILLAPSLLGLYVVAVAFASLLNVVATSTVIVATPSIARLDDRADAADAAARFVRTTAAACAAIAVPLFVLAPRIVGMLFGRDFVAAAPVARILVVAGAVYAVGRVLCGVVRALGRPLDAGIADAIGLGVSAVALLALLPTAGIVGAGIASLVGYSVTTLVIVRRASRALDVGVLALFGLGREARVRALEEATA